ncbi:MAG: nitrite reductase (NAD(P)H) small subunit [Planctomycetota bacterium]|nr:nitrite reductase (NAD(P)H) small subunit [Planctomycetota bacterium]
MSDPGDSHNFVPVARVGDIESGKGKLVKVDAREIALFFIDGEYLAIKNFCPHEADALWRGRVEEGAVICPNHGWRFELKTGKCTSLGDRDVRTYPVKVEGDRILVGI